jgi:hypothetical protein
MVGDALRSSGHSPGARDRRGTKNGERGPEPRQPWIGLGLDGREHDVRAFCPSMFPLARPLPSTASAAGRPTLFGSFVGTTGLSDFPWSCIAGVRPSALPARPAAPPAASGLGTSRFSRGKVPYVLRVCDRAGPPKGSRYRPWVVLPSASDNGVDAPEWLFSRLNTEPIRAPVNASQPALRSSVHDSGSSWVATPSM